MIQTNIKLKPLSLSDSNDVYELYANDIVLRSYPEKPIENRAKTVDFIERITSDGSWSWKIISDDKDEIFMGICSLHHWDKTHNTIEIGGTLLPQFWGKGIMKQAFEVLIQTAKRNFDVKSVLGKTLPTNQQAILLTQKLGFEIVSTNNEETILVKHTD